MKWAVYTFAFSAVFPFLLPGFLFRMLRRGGYAARLCDRFGLYPPDVLARLAAARPSGVAAAKDASGHDVPPPSAFVWIHAVSVGEVQVAAQLMRAWRAVEPSVRFCLSTTSSTGWRTASRETAPGDVLIYNPLDFPNFVKSALSTVRPRAVVLTEGELWPVFVRTAAKRGIPLFLVNARVSDRSAPRYRAARWLFKDVLGAFSRIFAQSALDRDRLLAALAPADRVVVSGSFKFDAARPDDGKARELRDWIGPGRVLLGASTWPGEEKVLLEAYARLRARLDGDAAVSLVLAPRHFEKADAVEKAVRAAGFDCVRRSRGETRREGAVFLADTTGELMGFYALADAAFVGKSLCARGGQNMIEPCLCGVPTVVGPHTENFRPVMAELLADGALVEAPDAEAAVSALDGFFAPSGEPTEEARALGRRAAEAVARRRGTVPRCVAAIREALA